jgi:hypothetical protein
MLLHVPLIYSLSITPHPSGYDGSVTLHEHLCVQHMRQLVPLVLRAHQHIRNSSLRKPLPLCIGWGTPPILPPFVVSIADVNGPFITPVYDSQSFLLHLLGTAVMPSQMPAVSHSVSLLLLADGQPQVSAMPAAVHPAATPYMRRIAKCDGQFV